MKHALIMLGAAVLLLAAANVSHAQKGFAPGYGWGGYGVGYGHGGYGYGGYGYPGRHGHHYYGPHTHLHAVPYIPPPAYQAGPPCPTVTYPYYTTRGPRDFLMNDPPSLGP